MRLRSARSPERARRGQNVRGSDASFWPVKINVHHPAGRLSPEDADALAIRPEVRNVLDGVAFPLPSLAVRILLTARDWDYGKSCPQVSLGGAPRVVNRWIMLYCAFVGHGLYFLIGEGRRGPRSRAPLRSSEGDA